MEDNQQNESRLLIQDMTNKFHWALWARYALAALGLTLVYVGYISGIVVPLGLNLVMFLLLYNLAAHLILFFRKKFSLPGIIAVGFIFEIFDIAAITFAIYITGWLDSPYWFLYLVLIIISGFGMFSSYSISVFLIALFSALFYLGLLYAAYLRILPIYGPDFSMSPQQLLYLVSNKAVFTTVSLLLLASSIYYFSKLLNQHRAELSQKNKQLLTALVKLKDIDRLKDDFVATASHELRTPLSVVRENMSLIEDGIVGLVNDQQKKLLATSRDNVDRLAKILDNLLDLSKIESRSLDLHREQVDIRIVAGRAIELLKGQADKKKVSLVLNAPQAVLGWIDVDQVYRVFVNLIHNALKYTGDKGQIVIGVEETGRNLQCYVENDGAAIAREDLPRMFERFVHLNGSDEKGAGLGLSICQGIIEMHGGKIWAESPPAGKNQGVRFTFTIPKVN